MCRGRASVGCTKVPGPKPHFERFGGNPDKFAELHGNGWHAEDVVKNLVIKGLTAEVVKGWAFSLARLWKIRTAFGVETRQKIC